MEHLVSCIVELAKSSTSVESLVGCIIELAKANTKLHQEADALRHGVQPPMNALPIVLPPTEPSAIKLRPMEKTILAILRKAQVAGKRLTTEQLHTDINAIEPDSSDSTIRSALDFLSRLGLIDNCKTGNERGYGLTQSDTEIDSPKQAEQRLSRRAEPAGDTKESRIRTLAERAARGEPLHTCNGTH